MSITAETGASGCACARACWGSDAVKKKPTSTKFLRQRFIPAPHPGKLPRSFPTHHETCLPKCCSHRGSHDWFRRAVRLALWNASNVIYLRSLIAQFARNAKTRFLDERSELAQARNRHANCGRSQTEAGVDSSSVIPDGSSDAANVRLVFFEIESVARLSYTKKVLLEFRNRSDGVLRQALWFDLWKNLVEFFLRHVGEKNFSDRSAIERNRSADARKNSQVFWRIQFFDIDSGIALPDSKVNRFASVLIERL